MFLLKYGSQVLFSSGEIKIVINLDIVNIVYVFDRVQTFR